MMSSKKHAGTFIVIYMVYALDLDIKFWENNLHRKSPQLHPQLRYVRHVFLAHVLRIYVTVETI